MFKVEVFIGGQWQMLAEAVTDDQAISLVSKGCNMGIITRKVQVR